MLINAEGNVFIGNRIDNPGIHWQMPQGGIDDDECPSDAVMRELEEETGIKQATIIYQSNSWYKYDLPYKLSKKIWGGKYRGQRQKWFLIKFNGNDDQIDLETHNAEFSQWKWARPDQLCSLIVPFKYDIYQKVISEFSSEINKLFTN